MDFHLLLLLQIEAKSLQNYWRLNKKIQPLLCSLPFMEYMGRKGYN